MNYVYGFRPPERACQPPFVQWTGENRLLSPPECESLIRLGEGLELRPGGIGNGDNHQFHEDKEYRCVETAAIWPSAELDWLYEKVMQRTIWANDDLYRIDLTGIQEGIQFLKYEAGEVPGHYKWHQDFGGGYSSNRKLSIVVQLSPGDSYAGCDLHLFTDRDFVPPFREQGEAVMFPAWTPHMVSSIERGTRYALAIWVSGPQFR